MASQFSFIVTFGALPSLMFSNTWMGCRMGLLQLERLNYAHMVFIPKKNEAKEVGDFRPISMLNTLVKLFLGCWLTD